MNKIKYSFSIILICFAFVLPAVNARSFSETEDALNITESLETNVTTMRSDEFYNLDCNRYWGDCERCIINLCRYCAKSGACTSNPYDECGLRDVYISSCPTSQETIIYIGVAIAGIVILIIKGILLYFIIKRRRRVKNGMIVGQRNLLYGNPGVSMMQVAQSNQEPSRPAAVHSTVKDNADPAALPKF